jgi:hypothetical protein
VPWLPELFSASTLARLEEAQRSRDNLSVPFFAGVLTGEMDALIGSFADEPEIHHPVRGRIRGVDAFTRYARETKEWLEGREASIEDVDHIINPSNGVEEVVLHLRGDGGSVDLPVAIAADKSGDRLIELRVYYSTWPLTGRHSNRPPVLQPSAKLSEPDFASSYQGALAAGDAEAIVGMFEPDGYAREPAGIDYVHRGPDGLREFYESLFSNGGGIPLEHCSVIQNERACALEYNVVRWGTTELLPPEAGIAVYVRGEGGKLAAARIYDDVDPPIDSLG